MHARLGLNSAKTFKTHFSHDAKYNLYHQVSSQLSNLVQLLQLQALPFVYTLQCLTIVKSQIIKIQIQLTSQNQPTQRLTQINPCIFYQLHLAEGFCNLLLDTQLATLWCKDKASYSKAISVFYKAQKRLAIHHPFNLAIRQNT